jgi:hypothetical protein
MVTPVTSNFTSSSVGHGCKISGAMLTAFLAGFPRGLRNPAKMFVAEMRVSEGSIQNNTPA